VTTLSFFACFASGLIGFSAAFIYWLDRPIITIGQNGL
jgi:hypothetical protein